MSIKFVVISLVIDLILGIMLVELYKSIAEMARLLENPVPASLGILFVLLYATMCVLTNTITHMVLESLEA